MLLRCLPERSIARDAIEDLVDHVLFYRPISCGPLGEIVSQDWVTPIAGTTLFLPGKSQDAQP